MSHSSAHRVECSGSPISNGMHHRRLLMVCVLMMVDASGILAAGAGFASDEQTIPFQSTESPTDAGASKFDPSTFVGPMPEQFILIQGQVTDQLGAGQANVEITLHRKTAGEKEAEPIARTITDRLGDFALRASGRRNGPVVIRFHKPSFAPIERELQLKDSGSPPFLGEELRGNLTISGRVSDALTDKPLSNAAVTARTMAGSFSEETDADGRFAFQGWSLGPTTIIVEAAGYGRETLDVLLAGDDPPVHEKGAREFEAEKEAVPTSTDPQVNKADSGQDHGTVIRGETPIVVRLKPERIVRVQVVEQPDRPIRGATVELLDEERSDFRTAVTDEQGRIEIRGLHFDARLIAVRLSHEDYVASSDFEDVLTTPEKEAESSHRLVMSRAGKIAGTIRDADTAQPLHGARITVGSKASESSPRDWSSVEGRFTISGIAPGTNVVTVHLADHGPELKVVEVMAGETTTVDIALGPGIEMRGVLKSSDGQPEAGAFVEASRWRGYRTLGLRAVSGRDGAFVIYDAPRDEFEVTVRGPRGGFLQQTIQPDASERIELTLSDRPVVPGATTMPALKTGDPVPDVTLRVTNGSTVRLSDLKGKTVLLDFWATWCGPCVAEIPHLVRVYEQFGARKDFVMLGVSLDDEEDVLNGFVKRRKIDWKQVCGDSAREAAEKFGAQLIPALFLIAPNGTITAMNLRGPEIVSGVEAALKSPVGP